MTGRLFSFCKNKRSHWDLSLYPEQVLVRKEVGHNEHKEFLCFAQELGSQQLRMKQSSGWLVSIGSGFLHPERGKGQRRERGRALWGCGESTEVYRLDCLVPQPFLLSVSYPGTALNPEATVGIEKYQRWSLEPSNWNMTYIKIKKFKGDIHK